MNFEKFFSYINITKEQDNEVELHARYFVANILPYAVVLGSIVLKLPQIVKILWCRSAEGISLTSVCLEMTSNVITASWGIAQDLQFKDYGESIIILVQIAVLLVLVGVFQSTFLNSFLVFVVETIALICLSNGVFSLDFHKALLSIQIFFGISSRVPQILMNYQNKSTGCLCFVSFYLAMVGGISRMLTTFHNVPEEKGKYVMLLQFGLSVVLNVIILLQIILYRKSTEDKQSNEEVTREKKQQ